MISMDSLGPTVDYPGSPTGSLLRGFRPSLHWLFQHIRGSGERDYVTKEDLRVILRGEVDPTDLDEAFDRLDKDGNGQITEDEFMNGFSTFLVEASAAQNQEDDFDTTIGGHMFSRTSSVRRSNRRKPFQEIVYQAQEGDIKRPSEDFKKSLKTLSLHNRLSIQDLWKTLSESNPEAVSDFEDFIGEMASEVQTAQNALKKQKEANRLEALELDVEMALIENESKAKLQQQSEILREKAQTKLEQRLEQKDQELGDIRDKLQQLENELSASRNSQAQLKHKYEESVQDREELLNRLATSEQLLQSSTATIDNLKHESTKQKEEQQGLVKQQEKSLSELKETYISEISELRQRLKSLQRNQEQMQYDKGRHGNSVQPDLLSTYHDSVGGRLSPSSLLDEIVESEGTTSPVLKDTMIYTSSPFNDRLSSNTVNGSGLDHLDLASKTATQSTSNNSVVVLRAKSNSRRSSRPTSMYCDRIEDMDLNWPPGNWEETRQEWLAQVASADITKLSPTHSSTPTTGTPTGTPTGTTTGKSTGITTGTSTGTPTVNNVASSPVKNPRRRTVSHAPPSIVSHSHTNDTNHLNNKDYIHKRKDTNRKPVKYFNDPKKCQV